MLSDLWHFSAAVAKTAFQEMKLEIFGIFHLTYFLRKYAKRMSTKKARGIDLHSSAL